MWIKNGNVIDGTGAQPYRADIAIKDGKIVKVSRKVNGDAKKVIDAANLVVTPGFIDSHAHTEYDVLYDPKQYEKIEQGITTSIGGQCGSCSTPLPKGTTRETADVIPDVGNEMDYFATPKMMFETTSKVPQGANSVLLMGHSKIRGAVVGVEDRKPTPDEMEQMKNILREEWGFDGLVMSDWLNEAPFWNELIAGGDLKMPSAPENEITDCIRHIKTGAMATATVKARVKNILKLIMKSRLWKKTVSLS